MSYEEDGFEEFMGQVFFNDVMDKFEIEDKDKKTSNSRRKVKK